MATGKKSEKKYRDSKNLLLNYAWNSEFTRIEILKTLWLITNQNKQTKIPLKYNYTGTLIMIRAAIFPEPWRG